MQKTAKALRLTLRSLPRYGSVILCRRIEAARTVRINCHLHPAKEKQVMTSELDSGPPSATADNPVASRRDLVAAAVTIAAVAGAADDAHAQTGLTVRRFDPPGMTSPPTYNHVVEVNGPHRVVYIAGQTGVDKDGKMAQGFRAQAVQVMENIKVLLAAVGGSFDNVVKLNSYLVDIATNQPTFRDVRASYFSGKTALPASTSVGCASARPGRLSDRGRSDRGSTAESIDCRE
jgi:enamine deaminase RidA (YjgF/YER057c/UK114 family)